jgi:hypothetical protein
MLCLDVEKAPPRSKHWWLTEAGWPYRADDASGSIVYRDPETRLWHTVNEAFAILAERSRIRA